MVQLSMNELTTFRWSFEEDVHNYAAADITVMGVWRSKLSDYGEEKGVELLAEYGMGVSNLFWAGGFTGSEGGSFQDGIDDVVNAIELASQLRARSLVVYSGGQGGHTRNHARRLLVSALQELAPLAEQEDVVLALEPMHPMCASNCTLLTSLSETLELIDEIGSRSVKVAFDTYHLCQDNEVLDEIDEAAPHVAVVHVADAREFPGCEQNRCPLGQGRLPLREIIGGLLSAGYDGCFDVELFGEDMEACDYRQLIRQSKVACEDLIASCRVTTT
jgi:sugar phosphate isomerase/epimerase